MGGFGAGLGGFGSGLGQSAQQPQLGAGTGLFGTTTGMAGGSTLGGGFGTQQQQLGQQQQQPGVQGPALTASIDQNAYGTAPLLQPKSSVAPTSGSFTLGGPSTTSTTTGAAGATGAAAKTDTEKRLPIGRLFPTPGPKKRLENVGFTPRRSALSSSKITSSSTSLPVASAAPAAGKQQGQQGVQGSVIYSADQFVAKRSVKKLDLNVVAALASTKKSAATSALNGGLAAASTAATDTAVGMAGGLGEQPSVRKMSSGGGILSSGVSESPSGPATGLLRKKKSVTFEQDGGGVADLSIASSVLPTPVKKLDFRLVSPSPDLSGQPQQQQAAADSSAVLEEVSFGFKQPGLKKQDQPQQQIYPAVVPDLAVHYSMSPSMEELMSMTVKQLRQVDHFSISHNIYGRVSWLEPVDLSVFLPTDGMGRVVDTPESREWLARLPGEVVVIRQKSVEVYPEDDQAESEGGQKWWVHHTHGSGLNVPAEIQLHNCFPIIRTSKSAVKDPESPRMKQFVTKLRGVKETEFVDYDARGGIWTFRVEHFSRYGITDEDQEEEEPSAGSSAAGVQSGRAKRMDENKNVNGDGEYPLILAVPDEDMQMAAESPLADSMDDGSLMFKSTVPSTLERKKSISNKSSGMPYARSMDKSRVRSMKNALFKSQPSHPQYKSSPAPLAPDQNLESGPKIVVEPKQKEVFDVSKIIEPQSKAGFAFAPLPIIDGADRQPVEFVDKIQSGFKFGLPEDEEMAEPDVVDEGDEVLVPAVEDEVVLSHEQKKAVKFIVENSVRLPLVSLIGSPVKSLAATQTTTPSQPGKETQEPSKMGFRSSIVWTSNGGYSVVKLVDKTKIRIEALDVGYGAASYEAYCRNTDAILEKQLNHTTIVEGSPAQLSATFDFKEFENSVCVPSYNSSAKKHVEIYEYERLVWSLAAILFDTSASQPIANSIGIEGSLDEYKREQVRKDEFSKWLKVAVKSATDRDIKELTNKAEAAEDKEAGRVFFLLTGRRLKEAVDTALKNRDYYLATILAQLSDSTGANCEYSGSGGLDECARDDLAAQISAWTDSGVISGPRSKRDFIEKFHLLIYRLLCCDFGPIHQSVKLDWKRTFAMYFWYFGQGNSPLSESVKGYEYNLWEDQINGSGKVTRPATWYAELNALPDASDRDLLYYLIKFFAESSTSLSEALDMSSWYPSPPSVAVKIGFSPLGSTRLSWHLNQVFKSRLSFVAMDVDQSQFKLKPTSSETSFAIVGNSPATMKPTTFEEAYLNASYCFELEQAGLWTWAVFVALHIEDTSVRDRLVRDILSRHINGYVTDKELDQLGWKSAFQVLSQPEVLKFGLASSQISAAAEEKSVDFLVGKLGITSQVIYEIKALHAHARADVLSEALFLAKGGWFSQAHDLLLKRLVPISFISDRMEIVKHLLNPLDKSHVPGWSLGAGLYLDYIDLASDAPSSDVLALMKRVNAAASKKQDNHNVKHALSKMASGLVNRLTSTSFYASESQDVLLDAPLTFSRRKMVINKLASDYFAEVYGQ